MRDKDPGIMGVMRAITAEHINRAADRLDDFGTVQAQPRLEDLLKKHGAVPAPEERVELTEEVGGQLAEGGHILALGVTCGAGIFSTKGQFPL